MFIPQSNGYGYSSQSSMVTEFYVLLINYNSRRWSCRFSQSEYWQTSEWLHFVFKPLLKEHVYFLAVAFSYSELKYENSFNPKRCRFFGEFKVSLWQIVVSESNSIFISAQETVPRTTQLDWTLFLFKSIWTRPQGCQWCQKNRKVTNHNDQCLDVFLRFKYSVQIEQTS